MISLALFGVAALQCSADDDSSDISNTGASFGGDGDSTDMTIGSSSGGSSSGNAPLNPLCGQGSCVPDDGDSCNALGGAGGQSAQGGAAGGVGYDPGDLGISSAACQVAPEEDCASGACAIERSCSEGGARLAGESCVAASDCAPGLACVGEGLAGSCRPYCCAGTNASCDAESFCDERQLLEHPGAYVPVCLPLDNCSLQEPFPCEGDSCVCKGSKACVVVRSNGKTSCTTPGVGETGDACSPEATAECAHGYVCTPNAGCLKTCSVAATEPQCPDDGLCVVLSGSDTGLGICIRGDSNSGASH